jgi:hypothetical protein
MRVGDGDGEVTVTDIGEVYISPEKNQNKRKRPAVRRAF